MDDHTLPLFARKVCSRCGEAKPLTEFTRRKTGKQAGRYEARCKACMRLAAQEYREQNPEQAAETNRRAADKSRERRNADYRARLAADAEYRKKRNDKSRAWRQRNRERIADYNAARYDEQPEVMRAAIKASVKSHPQHHKARKAVAWAVQSGKLPPAWSMVCEHCQEALASQYHHHNGYDSDHKLDVIALCSECHGKAHWVD